MEYMSPKELEQERTKKLRQEAIEMHPKYVIFQESPYKFLILEFGISEVFSKVHARYFQYASTKSLEDATNIVRKLNKDD